VKSDLDRLMAERNLQALLVFSDHDYNAVRDYLTNGARVSGGLIVKVRGQAPIIIANPMEIEEAARSGLTVYYEGAWSEVFRDVRGDRTTLKVECWEKCFDQLEIHPGRIGVYGSGEVNAVVELLRELGEKLGKYQFVGELGYTIFDEATVTKDADEIARIRSVAERTDQVLQATWDFIASHRAQDNTLMQADGTPLTIGDVKRFVRRALLDRQLEDTNMIFAQGRDAGFPHSRGQETMALRVGEAIVFDLFPRELGGGYHHDVTRTWCIGHAPAAVQEAYAQVMEAFRIGVEAFEEPGQPAHMLQDKVLDYFEGKGHQTGRSHPQHHRRLRPQPRSRSRSENP
jgi:Xaa-Pro aminopeptidase